MKSEDIAKIAGVSRSTVSRVVNNYANVPPETKEKVMKVIEAYNYMPNSFARTLAGKKSNTIGLFFIVEGGKTIGNRIFQNDFYSHYLNLLVEFANAKNYYVLISIASDESEYLKINQAFLEKRIDGAVIIGTQKDTLQKIQAENIKSSIVLFDYTLTNAEKIKYKNANITVINSQDEQAIEEAVGYLVKLGHQEIGFIRGCATSRSGELRFRAFQNAMKLHGLEDYEKYCMDGQFRMEPTYQNMKAKIHEKCIGSAYISANDFMAIAAMKALKEADYSVPEAVSLIGFDNSSRSNEVHPKLTTMAPDFLEMSQKAIDILDAKINEEKQIPELIEYPVYFYEKESCKKL